MRLLVVGAHAADFVWRAGGIIAKTKELGGEVLNLSLSYGERGESWNLFGHCTAGKLKGVQLTKVQYYKQFIRAWLSFHPNSSFYQF